MVFGHSIADLGAGDFTDTAAHCHIGQKVEFVLRDIGIALLNIDLGKVGAVQDLLRGIAKLMPKQGQEYVEAPSIMPGASAMVMRGQFALDDGDFSKAAEYFERALDQNPQYGTAYLGKVLAALQLRNPQQIDDYFVKLHDDKDYDRAIRFSDSATAKMLSDIRTRAHKKYLVKCVTVALKKRGKMLYIEELKLEAAYAAAVKSMELGCYADAIKAFEDLGDYRDARVKIQECLSMEAEWLHWLEQERIRKLEETYLENCRCLKESVHIQELRNAAEALENLEDYKDSREVANQCRLKADRLTKEVLMDEQYEMACNRMRSNFIEEIQQAIRIFKSLGDWKDSCNMIVQCELRIQKLQYKESLYAEELNLVSERKRLGLFSGKRRKEIDSRLLEIEQELKGLK